MATAQAAPFNNSGFMAVCSRLVSSWLFRYQTVAHLPQPGKPMPPNFSCVADVQVPGLLEQAALLLGPADPDGSVWLEDAGGIRVGFVRRGPCPWWLRWWSTPLAVHEVEEEPVVFRVRRRWSFLPRWRVLDAENE